MKNKEKKHTKINLNKRSIACVCTGALLFGVASVTNAAVGLDPIPASTPIDGNAATDARGYLDVTKAPYNMKNDGTSAWANSNALQDAIDDAYQHNYAIFFPPGTYLIQKQMECFQVKEAMTDAHVFVGSADGAARPVIKLKDGSAGFDDNQNPKSIFNYYCSVNGTGPGPATDDEEAPAAGYNFVMRGLTFDLGNNPGAIAVDLHAAQGCTIQDCDFKGADYFAAIQDLCGSGGHHANLKMVDGKYAFYVTTNRPMPVLTGIECINQSSRAFYTAAFTTITIVGFRIEQNNTKQIFELKAADQKEHLNLIDGSIEYTGSTAPKAIWNRDRSVYIRNVYIKNATLLVENDGKTGWDVSGVANDWAYVGDYQFFHVNNRKMIDGVVSSNAYGANTVDTTGVSAPPSDMISRHIWDEATFPHWELPASQLITVAPGSDDAGTINQAIIDAESDGHNNVFLQRGNYSLSAPIVLAKDTKLFGVSRNLTKVVGNFTSTGYNAVVKTVDDADSECVLAWMMIEMPTDQNSMVRQLNWKAGRHSMVREVHFRHNGGTANTDMKRILISGNGGGRWYGLFVRKGQKDGENINHRLLLVNGTTEPLSFYAYCIEYQESLKYMTEIKGGAENISIYGLKCETDINAEGSQGYRHTPALGITDSSNIMVMGESGLGHFANNQDRGLIEIEGSSDKIMVANADAGWRSEYGYYIVKNVNNGTGLKRFETGAQKRAPVGLFLLGASPTPIVYTPPSGGGGGGGNPGDIQEFVDTNVIDSSGDVEDWKSNVNASGGEFLIYKSNAVGDFVQFQNVNVPSPGDYDIYVGVQKISTAGIVQLQVNNGRNNIGSPVDCYAASSSFQEILFVTGKNFTSGGNKKFAFEVTGKNASASDYQIRVDYIKLVPAN